MSDYSIETEDDGLLISIDNIQGEQAELLETFQACQNGQCSCPTDEYTKLESMEFEASEGNIQIRLTARQDQTFDPIEIERCIEFTTHEANRKSRDIEASISAQKPID